VHIYKIHSTYEAKNEKEKGKGVIFQEMGYHVMAHSAHLLAHHLYNSL
jgi:hypothetical protein